MYALRAALKRTKKKKKRLKDAGPILQSRRYSKEDGLSTAVGPCSSLGAQCWNDTGIFLGTVVCFLSVAIGRKIPAVLNFKDQKSCVVYRGAKLVFIWLVYRSKSPATSLAQEQEAFSKRQGCEEEDRPILTRSGGQFNNGHSLKSRCPILPGENSHVLQSWRHERLRGFVLGRRDQEPQIKLDNRGSYHCKEGRCSCRPFQRRLYIETDSCAVQTWQIPSAKLSLLMGVLKFIGHRFRTILWTGKS